MFLRRILDFTFARFTAGQIRIILQSRKSSRNVRLLSPDRSPQSSQTPRLKRASSILLGLLFKSWPNALLISRCTIVPWIAGVWNCSGPRPPLVRCGILPRWIPNSTIGRLTRSTRCWKFVAAVALPESSLICIYPSTTYFTPILSMYINRSSWYILQQRSVKLRKAAFDLASPSLQ